MGEVGVYRVEDTQIRVAEVIDTLEPVYELVRHGVKDVDFLPLLFSWTKCLNSYNSDISRLVSQTMFNTRGICN